MNYTLYHCHSDYSLLDSCTKFNDYVDLAVKNDQKAIASTEHGKPLGWISKKMYCDEVGIKFIHGVEIYLTESLVNEEGKKIRDNYHTVLLAKNWEGVKELNALVSKSCNEDHYYYTNRITFDEFLQISNNIISTSACLASPLNKLPTTHPRYMELARKYDFLEIQPHNHPEQIEYNRWLLTLSKKTGVPLIAGTDTHNSSAYKAECRAILTSAKRKNYGDEDSFDLTYKTYDELVKMFEVQGALEKSDYLRASFDDWGNRCYLWCAQIAGYYNHEKHTSYFWNYAIDTKAAKDLGAKYILSAVYLTDPEATGLKRVREEAFETQDSYYAIYLYEIE